MTQPQHAELATNNSSTGGILRLAICALGICVCYMYYGVIQESLFSKQKIGPSFVLLLQCITNSAVARVWLSLDQWVTGSPSPSSPSSTVDDAAARKKNDDLQTTEISTIKNNNDRLHHPLLAMTSLCYVSAMVCSNEALHFVSYPTAVLAKSCKLIPTMAMGVFVEHKQYQWIEWMAALCITLGIVMFNFSRLKKTSEEDESSWVGLTLLSTSLLMDGFLGSCQGLLKQKRSLVLPRLLDVRQQQRKPEQHILSVRPPNAVETMLFVNLYAIVFLIPLTIANQQMADGLAMLQGSMASSAIAADEKEGTHRALLWGLVVINMTVAVGQIFVSFLWQRVYLAVFILMFLTSFL